MSLNIESGFKRFRIEFVEEDETGVPPTDPAWNRYADIVERFGSANLVQAGIAQQRGLGSADVQAFFLGAEDAAFPVVYPLHDRDLTTDAMHAGFVRNADNNLSASHTVLAREERTLDVGVDGGGARVYTLGLGGFMTSPELAGELDPPTPLLVTANYTFEKVRSFRIDQPSAATLLGINSTDAADTTQDVTVEDEDAGTTLTASLDGTTEVSLGSSTYEDIDAIRLSAETVGDVEVWINTGTDGSPVKGDVIATIRGQDYYGSEGDLGLPLLGSGSHASEIGEDYATLAGSTVQWGGSALADVVVARASLSINNMVGGETQPTLGTRRKKVLVGGTEITASAELVGEFQSHQNLDEHLGGTEQSFTWQIGTGANKTITITGALKSDPGGRDYEQSAALRLSTTLQGKTASIS